MDVQKAMDGKEAIPITLVCRNRYTAASTPCSVLFTAQNAVTFTAELPEITGESTLQSGVAAPV